MVAFSDIVGPGVAASGAALDIYGTLGVMKESKAITQYSTEELGFEQQIEQLRNQQFNLLTNRAQLENLRNTQKAGAAGKAAATNQAGNLQGSGYAGGQATIEAEGGVSETNLQQNQQIANQVFGLTTDINQLKVQIAQAQGAEATYGGWAALGGTLMGSASNIAKFTPGQ